MQVSINDALYGSGQLDQSWREGVIENLKALKASRRNERYWGVPERSQIDYSIRVLSAGGRMTCTT